MSSCYWRPHSGRCVRSPKPKRPYKLQEGRLHWGFVLFRMTETAILEKTIIKMLGVNTAWYHLMPFDISTLQPSSFLQVKQHLQHLIQEVPCSIWCVMFPSFASKNETWSLQMCSMFSEKTTLYSKDTIEAWGSGLCWLWASGRFISQTLRKSQV